MDSFVESGDEKFEEDIEEEMQLKMLSPGIKKVVMHLIAEDNVRKRKLSRLPEVSPESQVATTSGKKPKGKCNMANNRKRTRWTHEETLKLIECYESRACLWDAFDKEYHSKEKRERALNEIELELDVSVEEIKAKILNLRSQLGRENAKLRRTNSGQSTSELYKTTWPYWEQLQFLQPVMQAGRSRDSIQLENISIESSSFPNSPTQQSEASSGDNKDESHIAVINRPTKSRKKSVMESKELLLTKCLVILSEPTKDNEEKVNPFALYVAEKLSRFDPRTRAVAEKRISDVLFDIEVNFSEQARSDYVSDMSGTIQNQMDDQSASVQLNNQSNFLTMLQ